MRLLQLFFIFLIPTICYAVAPEDSFFVAIESNGKEATIISYDEDMISGFYGSKDRKEFAFCWDTETHFLCASKREGIPEVRYVRGPNTGTKYEKARATFARTPSAKDDSLVFVSYFECESGCEKLPVFIFGLVVYEP